MMLSSSRTFFFAAVAAMALVAQAETEMLDPVVISFSNETDSNMTDIMEFDCECGEEGISCLDAADEEACMCEDGDVICMEDETPSEVAMEAPVAAPVAMDDEPPAPDTESGAASNTMISMAISAVGIAALALN